MTRIRRCTRSLVGLFLLLVVLQVRAGVWSQCAPSIWAPQVDCQDVPETPANCSDLRTRSGCRTIWEIILCSPNNAYSAVADAAQHPGVDLAAVLDNPSTSLTLTIVNNTVFNKTGTWPGADVAPGRQPLNSTDGTVPFATEMFATQPTRRTANRNPFNPVMAQLWFYYNLLPGDYAPADLLSVNNTVRTALFFAYQNVTQSLGMVNDTMLSNPGFLAQSFYGQWPSSMTMTEAMAYPAGNAPISATVLGFETACNGYVYLMNNTMTRYIEV